MLRSIPGNSHTKHLNIHYSSKMAARAGEYDYLGGAEVYMNGLASESQQRKE